MFESLSEKLSGILDKLTGRGALSWLPDLEPWARTIAGFVRPGGIFYIHEGHPVLWALDDEQTTRPGEPRVRLLGWRDADVPG